MIYNLILILGTLIVLPKWLIQTKYKGTVLDRLGLRLPPKTEKKKTIWFHMVSVGETRAMIPIYRELKKRYPDAAFYFSSTTKTGHTEAKRSLPDADHYFFLPIDFSWTMRRLCSLLKPDLLVLSESEFWLNLMREVKKSGGKVVVLNGKISAKSAGRFAKLPSKSLFDQLDHLLVQNTIYANRFRALDIPEEKITVTGNLKLAIPPKPLTKEEKKALRARFGLSEKTRVITVGSTHEHEEQLLVPHIPPEYQILLVARHPERFASLKTRYFAHPQVIVVDEMGILPSCFQISELAILGGSFIPGIGGHNIFEPVQAKIPVIFGPFMENQPDLVEMILTKEAGIQTSAETLEQAIERAPALAQNAQKLAEKGSQVLEMTVKTLEVNHLLD